MQPVIGIAIDMGNGQARGVHPFLSDDLQLFENEGTELGVGMQRRAGLFMGIEYSTHHLVLGGRNRVVARTELCDPASAWCPGQRPLAHDMISNPARPASIQAWNVPPVPAISEAPDHMIALPKPAVAMILMPVRSAIVLRAVGSRP